ncbi:MDR family MFS transporter [Micromonospora olivasterospora]|uniref:EmrB/QacA subfamily drug resistance transporter n=1 Tax=Micromonospora olivasterospora TaxID=1880 RepID=A0A562IG12_MICOL|nr:MDR family MFS transporter [Micromonospora olivasterospora]TWH69937.1 EmrB/QacA subfamily drug resistance transporter [Micromonospora olivasterospora]
MATTPAAGTRTGVGLRSERGPVLAAIMLCTGLVAIDATIIATAVPSIVRDLGGFSQFPWLFSIYLLTQAVTVPLYGKFADSLGRRPVMFFGIAMFLLGSVLCGVAWSMPVLIIARAMQGVGAGAVQPISMTMVGDLYTVEERARVQGYLASVWAVASVLGPTLGGVFSDYLSWRWIFFVNLPLGAVAAWVLARQFTERVTRSTHRVDYLGAALLTGGLSLLILGLLEGGVAWPWASGRTLAIFAAGAALLVAFVLAERRAAEPVLPLWVFRRRTLVGGNLASLVVGAVTIGLSSYLPTYAEGVLGTSALVAGFALAALTVGWPIAATLSGRVYLRIGFRDTALIGSVFVIGGTALISLLAADSPLWMTAGGAFVVGVGLGLAASPTLVAVQSVVGWERRGVVTGTNMFSRSLGSAVGAAVFGAIANATLAARFAHPPAEVAGRMPDAADAGSLVVDAHAMEPAVAGYVRGALYDATHHVFLALVVVAVLGVGVLLLMPRRSEPLTFE